MGEDGGDGFGCVAAARRQYVDPSPVTSHSAMVLVQALFAGMHTTASPALEYIPPVAFCALRLLLALPFLGYLAHREGGRWFRGHEWAWPVPMGAAIGTAYALFLWLAPDWQALLSAARTGVRERAFFVADASGRPQMMVASLQRGGAPRRAVLVGSSK